MFAERHVWGERHIGNHMGTSMRFRLLFAVLSMLMVGAACSSPVQVSPTTLPNPVETSLEPVDLADIDVCGLVTEEDLRDLLGEAPEGDFDHMSPGNTSCTWRTSVGALPDSALSVQVADGGSGYVASDDLGVLREAMEFQEDVSNLGDTAFRAEWSEEGTAYIVAIGSRTVTVAYDQMIDPQTLQGLTEAVLARLP